MLLCQNFECVSISQLRTLKYQRLQGGGEEIQRQLPKMLTFECESVPSNSSELELCELAFIGAYFFLKRAVELSVEVFSLFLFRGFWLLVVVVPNRSAELIWRKEISLSNRTI